MMRRRNVCVATFRLSLMILMIRSGTRFRHIFFVMGLRRMVLIRRALLEPVCRLIRLRYHVLRRRPTGRTIGILWLRLVALFRTGRLYRRRRVGVIVRSIGGCRCVPRSRFGTSVGWSIWFVRVRYSYVTEMMLRGR